MRSRASALSFERDFLRYSRNGVVLLNIHAHHAGRLRGAISARKWGAKRNRDLAENSAGDAPAERAFNPVDRLDHLNLAAEDGKERALSPLGDGEFSGLRWRSAEVRASRSSSGLGRRRKQRNCCYVLDGQHDRAGSPLRTRSERPWSRPRIERPPASARLRHDADIGLRRLPSLRILLLGVLVGHRARR